MNISLRIDRFVYLASLAFLLASGVAQAQSLTTLAGHWSGVNFDTPAQLVLDKNAQGQVINVPSRQNFAVVNNQLDIAANGSFSGTTGGNAIAGTAAVGGQGVVTFTLPGQPVISLRANQSQDFLAAADAPENSHEMLLLVRSPAVLAVADLAGQWNMLQFQTPAELVQVQQPGGLVTDVQGGGSFETFTGTMTVNASGTISGTLGDAFNGTLAVTGPGQLTATVTTTSGTFPLTFHVNAGKNLMLTVNRELTQVDNFQEVIMIVRSPANVATAADLQGPWKINNLATPSGITLVRDNQGVVTDISERNSFEVGQQTLTAGNDRFFTALLDQPATGVFTIGSQGAVDVTLTNRLGHVSAVNFKLNAAKDTLLAISSTEGNEIIALTKAPAVPGAAQDHGLLTFGSGVVWAAGTGRKLQISTQLPGGWTDLTVTTGQHEFTPTLGPTEAKFFRVTE